MSRIAMTTGLAILFLAAGCGSDVEDVAEEAVVVDPVADAMDAMDAAVGAMGQTAQLQPVNESGIAGEATVTDRGADSEIMVRLTGAPANSSHAGHIHSGTCAAIGSVVEPLQEIATDTTGTGTMTASVAIPAMTLSDGQHVIVYHDTSGAPATCAQIPGHVM